MTSLILTPRRGGEVFVSTIGAVCIRQRNPWSDAEGACLAFHPEDAEELIQAFEHARQEALDSVPQEEEIHGES